MNPFRAWSTFWFRPTSARPLGFFRVLMGLIILAHLGLLANEADYWLTDQGLFQGNEAIDLAGPLRPSPLQHVQDPTSVKLFLGATGLVAVLFTVGWRTRINNVLLYLGLLSIQHRNLGSHGGPDSLLLLIVFYLMLSPSGAAYSLDARRLAKRRGTLAEPLFLPWAQRLIQLQICLVYLDTVILKTGGSAWMNGTALHYVLTNGEFGRFPETWLPRYPILINLMTHGALLTEFVLPAFLWFRATRPLVIVMGVSFHLGILGTMNVNLFGEMMIASYLIFLTPDEFQSVLRALNPVRWVHRERLANVVVQGRIDHAETPRGPVRAGPALAYSNETAKSAEQ